MFATIVVCLFVFVPMAWGQLDRNSSVLTVTGSAYSIVSQNITTIRLSVTNRATEARDAQRLTSNAVNSVLSTLKTYNVTDLSTDQFSLQPVYNYTDTPPSLVEFACSESISYKIPSDAAGETLDKAVQAGANSIDSVNSSSDNDDVHDAYNKALQDAVRNAETKATKVADVLSVCLEAPLTIQIADDGIAPTPTAFAFEATTMSKSSGGGAPTIIPGDAHISANVVIVYSQTPCTATLS